MKTSDLWVLEWSQKASDMRVIPLDALLQANRGMYRDNDHPVTDYLPIFVGSEDDCCNAYQSCTATLQQREAMAE